MEEEIPKYNSNLRNEEKVSLGVEGDTLVDVVENSLYTISEILEFPDFGNSVDKLRRDLYNILSCRKISLRRVTFPLPNSAIPDLTLSLDMRRKSVSVQSVKNRKKRILLNSVLRTL